MQIIKVMGFIGVFGVVVPLAILLFESSRQR